MGVRLRCMFLPSISQPISVSFSWTPGLDDHMKINIDITNFTHTSDTSNICYSTQSSHICVSNVDSSGDELVDRGHARRRKCSIHEAH